MQSKSHCTVATEYNNEQQHFTTKGDAQYQILLKQIEILTGLRKT